MSKSSVAITLIRSDLEKFLPNLQSVIAFENLLLRVNSLSSIEADISAIKDDIAAIKQDIDDIKAEIWP